MYMYQGLGQMLTKRLRHHQGCSETPKCAYVIYGQPLILALKLDSYKFLAYLTCIFLEHQLDFRIKDWHDVAVLAVTIQGPVVGWCLRRGVDVS